MIFWGERGPRTVSKRGAWGDPSRGISILLGFAVKVGSPKDLWILLWLCRRKEVAVFPGVKHNPARVHRSFYAGIDASPGPLPECFDILFNEETPYLRFGTLLTLLSLVHDDEVMTLYDVHLNGNFHTWTLEAYYDLPLRWIPYSRHSTRGGDTLHIIYIECYSVETTNWLKYLFILMQALISMQPSIHPHVTLLLSTMFLPFVVFKVMYLFSKEYQLTLCFIITCTV